jgi:hypothetical protein
VATAGSDDGSGGSSSSSSSSSSATGPIAALQWLEAPLGAYEGSSAQPWNPLSPPAASFAYATTAAAAAAEGAAAAAPRGAPGAAATLTALSLTPASASGAFNLTLLPRAPGLYSLRLFLPASGDAPLPPAAAAAAAAAPFATYLFTVLPAPPAGAACGALLPASALSLAPPP